MLLAMGKDVRVILIKLADRVHNMRTLDHMPPEKQILTAQETLDIYAPLSHRLGIAWIKSELEDLSLKYLHPEIYYQLKRNVAKKKTDREKYTEEVISIITKKLEAEGIEADVSGRPKHFYSIYQKMESQNLLYDQIYDLVAFRILVDTQREVLRGARRGAFPMAPGARTFQGLYRLAQAQYVSIAAYERDWTLTASGSRFRFAPMKCIGLPRKVSRPTGATRKAKSFQVSDIQRFAWLRQLLEWQENLQDPQEFLHSLKKICSRPRCTCLRPKGTF